MEEETTNVQGTETTAEEQENTAVEQERTFTQTEVNTLISQRLERERRKYPSAEELEAFRNWQKNQQPETGEADTEPQERDTEQVDADDDREELVQLRREKHLWTLGVSAEDVDYYAFKIGKLVTKDKSFEQAAEEYLRDHKIRGADASGEGGQDKQTQPARFTQPSKQTDGGPKTKEEIMAIPDRAQRRAAIAQNMKLFEKENE